MGDNRPASRGNLIHYWSRPDLGITKYSDYIHYLIANPAELEKASARDKETAKEWINNDRKNKGLPPLEPPPKPKTEEEIRADNLAEGTGNINNAFTSYDDNYYKAISQKYLNYYLPQVDDQYKKSGETLLYNLARNGILDSSAKIDAYAEADKIYGEQKQDITSKANALSSDAKKYISDQKTSLLNQLNVTGGDPLQASGFLGKAPAAISVTAPTQPNFSPLANLFDNITSIAKNETNAAMLSNQYGGGAGYAGSFNKPLKSRGSSKFAD